MFVPRFVRLSVVGLLLASVANANPHPQLPQGTPSSPDTQCATGVHAFFLRGEGPGNDMNVLIPLKDKLMSTIPGSTYTSIPYSHAFWIKLMSVYNGAYLFQDYVAEYARRCPQTKIFALGYSLGADALMNGLCGTSWPWFPFIQYVTQIPAMDASYAPNCEFPSFFFFLFIFRVACTDMYISQLPPSLRLRANCILPIIRGMLRVVNKIM